VVLDGNPLATEPEQITSLQVLATVLGGTPVHQSANLFPGR
jgi:predicted amidohydrolase YtcJ